VTDAIEARIGRLEERIRELEDLVEINQIILAYGPSVDSGSADAAAKLWDREGSYEFQADVPALHGQDAISAMVRSEGHRAHLRRGCAHIVTAPHVAIDGNTAVATCYSLMHHYVADTGAFQVSRVSANRWELIRDVTGWRVVRRTNRLLNGDEAARSLLALSATGGSDSGEPR
jgi:hypothetical protein